METIMKNKVPVDVRNTLLLLCDVVCTCSPGAVAVTKPTISPTLATANTQYGKLRVVQKNSATTPILKKLKCKLQLRTPRRSTELQLSAIMQSWVPFQHFSDHLKDDLVENAVLSVQRHRHKRTGNAAALRPWFLPMTAVSNFWELYRRTWK